MLLHSSQQAVDPLHTALKRYWGYDSFRPMQERIIQSLMAGRDVAVIMPTGGGKSLCYQLPALALGQTVVVISPLIALMQDQVAQLGDMGIPASFLNSAQPADEQRALMRAAQQGAFRLLYLSPERLARADTVDWLRKVPVAFFAIDEAHCISEWGHEFRPEYRMLNTLRRDFPDKPIAAFTASATRRVRHDILEQLKLREPDKYIASFHRANLRYVTHQCDKDSHRKLLLAAVRSYPGESVIVYAPTIALVEETVDFLGDRKIAAVPYQKPHDHYTLFLVGLDVGSTTVKATVVDAATDQILWQDYQRHETKQPEKTLEFLRRMDAEVGINPQNTRMFMTGSGGSGIAEQIGAKFVQEVTAVSLAVEKLHPEVYSVIELG